MSAESEALAEVSERIKKGITTLTEMRDREWQGCQRYARLNAKIDGLALAGSYLNDSVRQRSIDLSQATP